MLRQIHQYISLLTALLVSHGRAFAGLQEDLGLRAVLLFKKPTVSTGRLEVMEEGLDVLRAQREPFAIVSAVGPTRTGKSSLLGRAFFRGGEHENVFKVGSGVTSYTGGVWITSRAVEFKTHNGPINVLFIDTEGFSGVGGITSKTYEANLFGIVYLLSSAVIFNTMFPVDASTVASLNAHASNAVQMLQALKDGGQEVRRARPRLVWSVQSFNVYNLRNSGMQAEDLLKELQKVSRAPGSASALAVLGDAASSASTWLVERLFAKEQLVPVRRPHPSDEVVANLGEYNSSELTTHYLQDLDKVAHAVVDDLRPNHYCKEERSHPIANDCTSIPWDGARFVDALLKWLKNGFVLDHDDVEISDGANEAESLFNLGERNRDWLDKQCKATNEELRTKFYWYRESTKSNDELRREAVNAVGQMMKGFRDAALSRLVESGVFWKYPAKGATLVESQSQQAMERCQGELDKTRRYMENWLAQRDSTPQPPQRDQESACAQWAVAGECDRNPDFMLAKCATSCDDPVAARQLASPQDGSTKLIYKLMKVDSGCDHGGFEEYRINLGSNLTLEACAEAVSTNCKCGRGFEFDEMNGGFCGCGAAGTPNSDCTASDDDFIFGDKRYLLYNPECIDDKYEFERKLVEAPAASGAGGGAAAGGGGAAAGRGGASGETRVKKARQVCFDVYD